VRKLVLAALLSLPAIALANGAATPDTKTYLVSGGGPGELAMNTTFGFLFSQDGGASWRWTCHEAVIGTAPFTPRSFRSPGGTLFVIVPIGLGIDPSKTLWRTPDRGCDWSSVESLGSNTLLGMDFQPGTPSTVVVVGVVGSDGTAWRSTDDGVTFGAPVLTATGEQLTSVRFAPGAPLRAYASGSVPGSTSTVWRSDDGGKSWSANPLTLAGNPPVTVLAVSPANPDDVWLRSDAQNDVLLLSTDGAASFHPVFTLPQMDVEGFALTNGGDDRWVAVRRTNGLFAATGGSTSFARAAYAPNARCLEAAGETLYLCGDPYSAQGFAPGTSSTDGAVFSTSMSFSRVTGQLSCPAGSTSAPICDTYWPTVQLNLGLVTPTPTPNAGGGGGGGCGCDLGSEAAPDLLFVGAAGALVLAFAWARNRP
jgi:hypothetical protein